MADIQKYLEVVLAKEASDLHLAAKAPPIIRVHGELRFLTEEGLLESADCERLLFSLINADQKQLLQNNKELDFSFDFSGKARFRVNAYYRQDTLAASFRAIPNYIKSIEELGLPKICHDFARLKQGFILVTGPTGHGKSTTLAAIIRQISEERACHIVTIEDPVEFIFQSKMALVSQRELHSDTLSWNNALRSVLREDPDVVLIGEMRDYETMAAALTIAETGHLVFSTLHTNSASQSIDRIIDVFPEGAKNMIKTQLSVCLEAIISQRLVPMISGARTLAYEVMVASSAVKNSIREGKTFMLDNIIQTSANVGMSTLEASLDRLLKDGKISLETAKLYALRPEDISKR